jgi:ThiF family protein
MREQAIARYERHLRLAEKVTGLPREEAVEKFLARVLATGDEEYLQSRDGRLAALTAANLIARFCPKIDIDFGVNKLLQQEALELISRIDRGPLVDFRAADQAAWPEYEAVLYIGRMDRGSLNSTSVVGQGWLAAISSAGPTPALPAAPYNPFGPILAACFGAADVFKRLLHADPEKVTLFGPSVFSAYSYQVWGNDSYPDLGPVPPPRIDLPVTLLAGAGAVGNAFAYSLSELPGVRGQLAVVDKQDVEDDSNLNRYSLAYHEDAHGARPARKVDLVNRIFEGSGIRCTPHKEEIGSYLGRMFAGEEPRPRAVISAVDNNEIRPTLQRLWPDTLIEGATSDSLFQVSRHAYADGLACLMCIHTVNGPEQNSRSYEEVAADQTGLAVETVRAALRDDGRVVTEAEVTAAPEQKRSLLKDRLGKRICSVLSELAQLSEAPEAVPRAAAVSFVSMAAGALAAAELVKWAAELRSPLETLYQMDMFMPLQNAMLLPVEKTKSCDCNTRRREIERYRRTVYGG